MIHWLDSQIASPSKEIAQAAIAHQNQLTKPEGSLGMLEDIAIRLCSMQKGLRPRLNKVDIVVFAADHGVAAEGVSAFPQEVTVEMINNFSAGGAAICVMADTLGVHLSVVNLGTSGVVPSTDKIIQNVISTGTRNFCQSPAMTAEQLQKALEIGAKIAEQLHADSCELFIGGEMGIANTTSAAALACALLRQPPEVMVGFGTGVDEAGRQRKISAVTRGLSKHHSALSSPLDMLRILGGFEIAALTASYLRCAQLEIPSLIDGFICSVAALFAVRINPNCRQWLFFSHQSAENGHAGVLSALDAQPLLNLNMRLGEGSGAAAALPLMRMACDLHNRMATFSNSGVSGKNPSS